MLMMLAKEALESVIVVTYESAVTFQVLLESRVRATEFAVLAALTAPVNEELFLKEAVSELILSRTISPVMVCPSAVRITVPPFEPLVPH